VDRTRVNAQALLDGLEAGEDFCFLLFVRSQRHILRALGAEVVKIPHLPYVGICLTLEDAVNWFLRLGKFSNLGLPRPIHIVPFSRMEAFLLAWKEAREEEKRRKLLGPLAEAWGLEFDGDTLRRRK